jgi:hypothetical protein
MQVFANKLSIYALKYALDVHNINAIVIYRSICIERIHSYFNISILKLINFYMFIFIYMDECSIF